MKKFVTTLALGLMTAVCALAFTACNDSEEVKTTVTEDEWKNAISVIAEGKTNFKSEWDYRYESDGVTEEVSYVSEIDIENKVGRLYYSYEEEGETVSTDLYCWIDSEGNAYYTEYDYNSGEVEKHACDEEEGEDNIKELIDEYAGGWLLTNFGLADKYAEFEYDEESKSYTATLENEEAEGEMVLKFEDGKLVYFAAIPVDEHDVGYVYSYTYGINVTVPKSVLDLPVVEE